MNKRRLLKLADLLEADAKNKKGIKFDLIGWGHSPKGRMSIDCGTTACAIGLAVLSGAFPGLKNCGGDHFLGPIYKGKVGYDAASELFGIANNEAEVSIRRIAIRGRQSSRRYWRKSCGEAHSRFCCWQSRDKISPTLIRKQQGYCAMSFEPTIDIRKAHDVRRLTACESCKGIGDRKFMPKIYGKYFHGFCALKELGIDGILKLPVDEIDKLSLGEIGPEAMKTICDAR